jgi:two-component system, cell cycle response regulator
LGKAANRFSQPSYRQLPGFTGAKPASTFIKQYSQDADEDRVSIDEIMNLLIAEDDITTRCALEEMTTQLGYTVTSVGDGDKAWQALSQAAAPTLALLDWNMPGLDGLEVIRNIRLEEPHVACYLIVLTSSREKDVVVEALQAGANDFIRKPCDFRELQARLAVGSRALEAEAALSQCRTELKAMLLHDCAICPGRTTGD